VSTRPSTNTSASTAAPNSRANPHHRATIHAGLAKLTALLTEIGVIDDTHRPGWSDFGLIAPV